VNLARWVKRQVAWESRLDDIRPEEERAEAGYAAVDALVALTILSMTLILAINAGAVAKRAAIAADETRRAAGLLKYLVETSPAAPGAIQGVTGSFSWAVTVRRVNSPPVGNVGACRREAAVKSLVSGRTFNLATTELCAVAGAS
jgi:hypothetical protein